MEFLRSRRDDPALKEREHALQSLDLAYHKYREIKKNLDEGTKVCIVNSECNLSTQGADRTFFALVL